MNTEEIKMLIELFGNVAEGSYYLLLIYMIKGYLYMFLGFSIGFFAIAKVTKIIKTIIDNITFMSKIRNALEYYDIIDYTIESQILNILSQNKKQIHI